jgi:hypothetical protein
VRGPELELLVLALELRDGQQLLRHILSTF